MKKLIILISLVLSTFVFAEKTKTIIISGKDSHNWSLGADLLAKDLKEQSGLDLQIDVHRIWPKDEKAFDAAVTLAILCDGGGRHVLMPLLEKFDKLMEKGIGLVNIHYAVEIPKDKGGDFFLKWVGGYFETH